MNPTENGLPAADGVWTDAEFELTIVGKGDLDMTTDGLPAYQPRVKENGRYRAMTGDMDPIAVLDENGQILDLDRRLEVYKDLAKMGFQHPESLTWDNAAERAKYLFDFDLANGKGRALLAYGPDGTRRAAYFDSRKSRLSEGLMTLVGTDMVMEATKVVKGEVPRDRGAGDGRRASLHHAGRGERRGPHAVAGRPAHPPQPRRQLRGVDGGRRLAAVHAARRPDGHDAAADVGAHRGGGGRDPDRHQRRVRADPRARARRAGSSRATTSCSTRAGRTRSSCGSRRSARSSPRSR